MDEKTKGVTWKKVFDFVTEKKGYQTRGKENEEGRESKLPWGD